MFERLKAIEEKYNELQASLRNPEVMNDFNKIKELSKEASDLEETVNKYHEYNATLKNIEEAKELMKDDELKDMAKLEYEELNTKLENLTKELELLLIPKDEYDGKNVIMEIR